MSTHTVIIDSRALRDFAAYLGRFNSNLESEMRDLQAHFQRLGETWRDPAYASFEADLEQTVTHLRRFQDISEQFIVMLRSKADRVDAVHKG